MMTPPPLRCLLVGLLVAAALPGCAETRRVEPWVTIDPQFQGCEGG